MLWTEVRSHYPQQWLLVEAIDGCSTVEHHRLITRFAVIEQCDDGLSAFHCYVKYHKLNPDREYYYVHTERPSLDIIEETCLGLRMHA